MIRHKSSARRQSVFEKLRPLPRRSKPYKAAPPEETIVRIRAVLRELHFDLAEHNGARNGRCCSHYLRLVDPLYGRTLFQTVGKGLSDEYARASAYGEMIERIQNLAWFTILKYPSEPEKCAINTASFKYYPDEKPIDNVTFQSRISVMLKGENIDGIEECESYLAVPFWNATRHRNEYWPLRAMQVIVGSNGMCSGNTRTEALIHGICELFERYVLKEFFLNPFCPPDVPLRLFEGHGISNDIGWLAKKNNAVASVKDCSMNRRLPVLGLLIRGSQGKYAFHLGADPNPITALERCFTEMLQGGGIRLKNENELPDAPCDVRTSRFWREQLHFNIRCYGGHWPRSLLRRQPDYAFAGFEHTESDSDEDDLGYLLDIIRTVGFELCIRDNSFTGFPSYYVYMPGVSEMANVVDSAFVKEHLAFDRYIHVVTNPSNATERQRLETAELIGRYAKVAPSGHFNAADYMMYYPSHPIAAVPSTKLAMFIREFHLNSTPAIPKCFFCELCSHTKRCNYSLVSDLWEIMKARMASSQWRQCGVQEIRIEAENT